MLNLLITVNHKDGSEEHDLEGKCATFGCLPAAVSAALEADPIAAANESEISSLVIVAVPMGGVRPFHKESSAEISSKAAVYMSMDDQAMMIAAATGGPEQITRRKEFFAGVRSIAASVVSQDETKGQG